MVVYEGPSMLNGQPIVGIVTGLTSPSSNIKTGPMAQLWILDAQQEPHVAVKTGEDESVCGDCPARGKWCYVTTFQGPLSIWRTWKNDGYPPYNSSVLTGHRLRLGAYGDPAALPVATVRELVRHVDRITGYTHAWRNCDHEFQNYCMASVDSHRDYEEAVAAGWRTFRVSSGVEDILSGETTCPASDEGGHKLQCYDCCHCDGKWRERVKGNIVIRAHGSKKKKFNDKEKTDGT